MNEIWVPIKGTNELYEVSNLGNVRSKDRYSPNRWGPLLRKGKLLKPSKDGCGYHQIQIYLNGKRKIMKIHRLVAQTFLDKKAGCQVNHKDCNKNNNSANNLEWITHKENVSHAVINGRLQSEKRILAALKRRKFSDADISTIKEMDLSGKTRTSIAKVFNVSQPTISLILLGKTYKTTSSVSYTGLKSHFIR